MTIGQGPYGDFGVLWQQQYDWWYRAVWLGKNEQYNTTKLIADNSLATSNYAISKRISEDVHV